MIRQNRSGYMGTEGGKGEGWAARGAGVFRKNVRMLTVARTPERRSAALQTTLSGVPRRPHASGGQDAVFTKVRYHFNHHDPFARHEI